MLIFKSRQELEHAIVTMHRDGWSKRALAKHFNMSRNTIRSILRKYEGYRDQGHSALGAQKIPRKSKLDDHMPRVKELLEKYPNITGQRLFEELTDAGFKGGISIIRQRLADLRPRPKKTPVIRFETLGRFPIRVLSRLSPIICQSPLDVVRQVPKPRAKLKHRLNMWKATFSMQGPLTILRI